MSNENKLEDFFKVKKTETEAGKTVERILKMIDTDEKRGLIASVMQNLSEQQQQQQQ